MLLNRASLSQLPQELLPRHDVGKTQIGWMHFGPGKFFQAHTAGYIHKALNKQAEAGATPDLGIIVVKPSLSNRTFERDLKQQGGLFTHIARSPEGDKTYVNAAISQVVNLAENPRRVVAAIEHHALKGISLTITQAGYRLNSTSDGVDLSDPQILHDVKNPWKPVTVIGALAAGLVRRAQDTRQSLPLIIPCDNLPGNGDKLAAVLTSYMDAAFPREQAARARNGIVVLNTMVDRIVPDKDPIGTAQNLLMQHRYFDACATVCDPHKRWVIAQPDNVTDLRLRALIQAGVEIVRDVRPHEEAKIRGLNGAHMAGGLVGTMLGLTHIHETLAKPPVRGFMTAMMNGVAETSTAITDKASFTDIILRRVGNEALPDKVSRLVTQTAAKVSQRLVNYPAINAGTGFEASAMAVAVWLHALRDEDVRGNRMQIADEPTQKLRDAVRGNSNFNAEEFLVNAGPKVFDGSKIEPHKRGNAKIYLRQVGAYLKSIEQHGLLGALDRAFPAQTAARPSIVVQADEPKRRPNI